MAESNDLSLQSGAGPKRRSDQSHKSDEKWSHRGNDDDLTNGENLHFQSGRGFWYPQISLLPAASRLDSADRRVTSCDAFWRTIWSGLLLTCSENGDTFALLSDPIGRRHTRSAEN